MTARQRFGIPGLDELLGGGLKPGALTVIAGSTGAGKTQLGLRWAHEGGAAEGHRGVICDLTSRGDSQHHQGYAAEQFGWPLVEYPLADGVHPDAIWNLDLSLGEYLNPFAKAGRRVTRRDLDDDAWHAWRTDLARVLRGAAAFFYGHFVRGCRRVVIDGIEPTERSGDSIQYEFFEYLLHQLIRKEDTWAARELFREQFRAQEARVAAHHYNVKEIGCLFLYTTPQVLLDDLMAQPLGEGDVLANATTIVQLGRTRVGDRMGRALHVAKHRGSACHEGIVPYRLTARGIEIGEAE